MKFDREKQIASMQKPVDKLLGQLAKQGVEFSPTDGEMNNVIFKQGNKEVKISHHSFYRYSGISVITRTQKDSTGKETNWTEVFPVTDEMYMQQFMKPIIETLLKV